jgi:thiol-disulfide isomerase/thioredoxin
MMRKRILAASLSMLAAMIVAPQTRAQDSGIPVGSDAPVASVANIAGTMVNLADFIGKKPVVMEFWATWCANCKQLEPQMLAAAKKYESSVQFIGVAVAINQTLDRVQKYVAQYKYPYPMLWDKDGVLAIAYDVPATSYLVVIDRHGKIVYTGLGGDQNLEAAIRKAL